MDTAIIPGPDNTAPSPPPDHDSTDIFLQMEALGIDATFLLEIAAHDLLSQYGADALTFSLQIEKTFQNTHDFQSAKIWHKIAYYLEKLNGNGNLVAH